LEEVELDRIEAKYIKTLESGDKEDIEETVQKALLICTPPSPTRRQVTLVRAHGRGSIRNVKPITTMESD
jgi:hypothetical protein